MRSTIASEHGLATPSPVLAEMRRTSSGAAADQARRCQLPAWSGLACGRSILLTTGMSPGRSRSPGTRREASAPRGPARRRPRRARPHRPGARAETSYVKIQMARRVDQAQPASLPAPRARPRLDRRFCAPRSRSIESSSCSRISCPETASGHLEYPVGQGRLSVIDVRDDREARGMRSLRHDGIELERARRRNDSNVDSSRIPTEFAGKDVEGETHGEALRSRERLAPND